MKNQERITDETIHQFKNIIKFIIGPHHILWKPRQDPQRQWLATQILLFEEEVESITQDWLEAWWVPLVDHQLSADEDLWHDDPPSQKDGE